MSNPHPPHACMTPTEAKMLKEGKFTNKAVASDDELTLMLQLRLCDECRATYDAA